MFQLGGHEPPLNHALRIALRTTGALLRARFSPTTRRGIRHNTVLIALRCVALRCGALIVCTEQRHMRHHGPVERVAIDK